MIRTKRRSIALIAVFVSITAFGVLAANLIPDQVFAAYAVSGRWFTALYAESRGWIAAATHRERLPARTPFSVPPVLPYDSAKAVKRQQIVEWGGHILFEVKTLTALPQKLQAALGVQKLGLDGIADRGGRYNATDVVDPTLPRRRFLVAGLDGDAALIAIEHGGFAWGVEVTLFSNIRYSPVVRRTWGLLKSPKTLQALVNAVPPL